MRLPSGVQKVGKSEKYTYFKNFSLNWLVFRFLKISQKTEMAQEVKVHDAKPEVYFMESKLEKEKTDSCKFSSHLNTA